jgi:hypothetical protein
VLVLLSGLSRYDVMMQTNLKSVYNFCQLAHPLLKVGAHREAGLSSSSCYTPRCEGHGAISQTHHHHQHTRSPLASGLDRRAGMGASSTWGQSRASLPSAQAQCMR